MQTSGVQPLSRRISALSLPLALSAGALIGFEMPALAAADSADCEPGGIPVTVEVHDLRSTDGNLTITIYGDRPEDFLGPGRKLARKRVAISGPTTSACLSVPRPGDYAIAIYHDEDDNHDFDRTFVGLPDEGYGFSNDAETIIGPPSYEDARFEVPAGGWTLTIRMRY